MLAIYPALVELVGRKRADKIVISIEESKKKPLHRLLTGLGIPGIGAETAKALAKHFRHLDNLARASENELMDVPGIGRTSTYEIVFWFSRADNQNTIERLRLAGLNFEEPADKPTGPFSGKKVCITGSFEKPRHELVALLESKGAQVVNSVTRDLDYILVGRDAGSKSEKAAKLNIPILSLEEI